MSFKGEPSILLLFAEAAFAFDLLGASPPRKRPGPNRPPARGRPSNFPFLASAVPANRLGSLLCDDLYDVRFKETSSWPYLTLEFKLADMKKHSS